MRKYTLFIAAVLGGLVLLGVAIFHGRGDSVEQGKKGGEGAAEANASAAMADLEGRLRLAEQRASEAEKDVETLLRAVGTNKSPGRTGQSPESLDFGSAATQALQVRFHRAQSLVRRKMFGDALREYVECYRSGAGDAGFAGVRTSFLLDEMTKLAKVYPEARTALMALRDEASGLVNSNSADKTALAELLALNRALGDSARTYQMYGELPENDPRKTVVAGFLYDAFVDSKRYSDASIGRSYQSVISMLERDFVRPTTQPAKVVAASRAQSIVSAATYVEVLAGAGDVTRARELVDKIAGLDSSKATQELLRQHLARAGRPEVLEKPGAR